MQRNKMEINTVSDSYHKQITIRPLYRVVDLNDLSTYAMFHRAMAVWSYRAGIKLHRAQMHVAEPTQSFYICVQFVCFRAMVLVAEKIPYFFFQYTST